MVPPAPIQTESVLPATAEDGAALLTPEPTPDPMPETGTRAEQSTRSRGPRSRHSANGRRAGGTIARPNLKGPSGSPKSQVGPCGAFDSRKPTPKALFIGIDEAGYGPNLGPLVVGATAFLGPAGLHSEDWWQRLHPSAGRAGSKAPYWIDDSKRICTGANGAGRLASQMAAWVALLGLRFPNSLDEWIDLLAQHDGQAFRGEHWYVDPSHAFAPIVRGPIANGPVSNGPAANGRATQPTKGTRPHRGSAHRAGDCSSLRDQLELTGLRPLWLRARMVFAPEFNRDLDEIDSKAAVELRRITELGSAALEEFGRGSVGAEEAHLWVDRLGGRKNYRDLVEQWAGDRLVMTIEESNDRSVYRFEKDGRPVEVVFRVKGDQKYFPIALASMLAKHLREMSMARFNAWWCERVSGLTPTAGYPQDARRFWKQIEPHMQSLGLTRDLLWRRK